MTTAGILPAELPIWRDLPDGVHQQLVKSWTWLGVTIPAGFVTDGASSPWYARWLIPRRGKYTFAAYIHDHCLKTMSRREAALKFYKALVVLGVPKWKRRLMYRAVRTNDILKHGG